MGYNQNYSGGGSVTVGGSNYVVPHAEDVSGTATWHWKLDDDAGVESINAGAPQDLTGTLTWHPEGPGAGAGYLDAFRSASVDTGAIGATTRITAQRTTRTKQSRRAR